MPNSRRQIIINSCGARTTDPCLHIYMLPTHILKIQNPYAKTKFQRSFGACICAFGASPRNLSITQKRASGACIVAPNLYPFGSTPECCYTSSKRMFFRSPPKMFIFARKTNGFWGPVAVQNSLTKFFNQLIYKI